MKYTKRLIISTGTFFFAILIIPLMILNILSYLNSKNDNLDYLAKSYRNKMQYVATQIQNDLSYTKQAKKNLQNNKYFYNFIMNENAGSYVYITNAISEINILLNFGEQMYYYNRNSKMFYSKTIIPYDEFFKRVSLEDDFELALKNRINNSSDETYIYDFKTGMQSAVIYPFESDLENNGEAISYLIFLIPKRYFENQLKNIDLDNNEKSFIFCENELIYSSLTDINTADEARNYIELQQRKNDTLFLSGKSGDVNTFTFISKSINSASLRKLFLNTTIFNTVSILLGCIIIFMFIRKYYTPISDLATVVESVEKDESGQLNNLFDSARQILENLKTENIDISQENFKYKKEVFVTSLLSGVIPKSDINYIKTQFNEFDITLMHKNFICLIFELGEITDIDKTIQRGLAKLDGVSGYLHVFYEMDSGVLIISSDEKDYQIIEKLFCIITSSVTNSEKSNLFIGVGVFIENVENISKSYTMAQFALNLCHSNDKHIVYYKDIDTEQINNKNISDINISSFCGYITKKDYSKMMLCVVNIKNNLKMINKMSLCNSICLKFISNVLTILNFEGISFNNYLCKKLSELLEVEYDSNLQYIKLVDDIYSYVINLLVKSDVNETEKSSKLYSIDDITQFILSNINSCDLSIKMIADEYNTSVSNLSHFFKRSAKITLSDYISKIKMDNAKIMLIHSDLSICQISQDLGYYHTSNFIRRFKKEENLTPNEYREQSHKKNNG